jgi:hypothetical protein
MTMLRIVERLEFPRHRSEKYLVSTTVDDATLIGRKITTESPIGARAAIGRFLRIGMRNVRHVQPGRRKQCATLGPRKISRLIARQENAGTCRQAQQYPVVGSIEDPLILELIVVIRVTRQRHRI